MVGERKEEADRKKKGATRRAIASDCGAIFQRLRDGTDEAGELKKLVRCIELEPRVLVFG